MHLPFPQQMNLPSHCCHCHTMVNFHLWNLKLDVNLEKYMKAMQLCYRKLDMAKVQWESATPHRQPFQARDNNILGKLQFNLLSLGEGWKRQDAWVPVVDLGEVGGGRGEGKDHKVFGLDQVAGLTATQPCRILKISKSHNNRWLSITHLRGRKHQVPDHCTPTPSRPG